MLKLELLKQGIGKALLAEAEKMLIEKGVDFLQVKTLSEDREDPFYKKRDFSTKLTALKRLRSFLLYGVKPTPAF